MDKTKLNLLFLVFTFWCIMHADAQTFQWAKRIGNPSPATQIVNATATDAAGNVYLTGYFGGTVDFDPNGGTFNLTSNSGSQEIYVCKLSAAGNFVWAKSFSGPMPDWATSISTDATGNVYVTGVFQGTVDFDPGASVYNMTTAGGTDVFLFKLTNAGNLVWAIKLGSTAVDQAKGVAVDASGNVYIAGSAGASFDADPGPPVFPLNGNYLIKMSSAGNFIWARLIGGMSTCLAVDGSGNIYITGQFSGTVDFDPIGTFTLTSAGSLDVFVSKFTPAGVFVWARRLGGTANDMAAGIAIDAAGNVHTTGSFDDVCDFDPGAAVYNLTSAAGGMALDMFISKLNTSGNFVWAKRIGGANGAIGRSIDLDATANVYITGSFSGTVDFNPGTATNNLVAASSNEAYLLKLNAAGNYVWAYDFGTGSGVNGSSVVIDPWGGIIASGQFGGTGDFNPYSGVANLTSNGTYNIYVLKLYVSPLPIELLTFDASQNKNTVDITWQTATELNNDYFTIAKSKDGNEFEEIGKVNGAGNSTTVLRYSFTDKQPYLGISYYRLKQTDFNGEFSYSKTVAVNLKVQNNEFIIYNNSSSGNIIIIFNNSQVQSSELVIQDVTGRVVYGKQIASAHSIINAHFSPGIYIANVTDGRQQLTKKFIIN